MPPSAPPRSALPHATTSSDSSSSLPTSTTPPPDSASATNLCAICYDNPSQSAALAIALDWDAEPPLPHCAAFCAPCLETYWTSAVYAHRGRLRCPCGFVVAPEDIGMYLTDRDFQKLLYFRAQDPSLPPDEHRVLRRRVFCRDEDCLAELPGPGASRHNYCPRCYLAACSACNRAPHSGDCTAAAPSKGGGAIPGVRRWLLRQRTCPCCGILVEKVGGCNHVACVACGADWCWACRGVRSPEGVCVCGVVRPLPSLIRGPGHLLAGAGDLLAGAGELAVGLVLSPFLFGVIGVWLVRKRVKKFLSSRK